jgi:hypothetical protein
MEYLTKCRSLRHALSLFLSPSPKSCSFLHGSVGTTIRKQEYYCVQRKTSFGSFTTNGNGCTNCIAVGSYQRGCASLCVNILSRTKIIQSTSSIWFTWYAWFCANTTSLLKSHLCCSTRAALCHIHKCLLWVKTKRTSMLDPSEPLLHPPVTETSVTVVAGLLARSQYPEGPATGHLGTSFSWFPCV